MTSKRILVTGSSGFCGSVIFPKLQKLGHQVTGLDCKPGPYTQELVDISKPFNLKERYDVIFHLAAKLEHDRCSKKEYYDTNVTGTANVLSFATKSRAFLIYVSTTAIYGSPQSPISEETSICPDGDYALTKYLGEKVCSNSKYSKLAIVRPSVLIGKKRLGIYNVIFKCLLNNLPIPVLGDGQNKISFVNIDDFCEFLIHIFQNQCSGLITNFGGRIPGFWNNVLKDLKQHTNSDSIILHVPLFFLGFLKILSTARLIPVTNWQLSVMYKDYYYEDTKMSETGYNYKYETIDALKDMADYYKSELL